MVASIELNTSASLKKKKKTGTRPNVAEWWVGDTGFFRFLTLRAVSRIMHSLAINGAWPVHLHGAKKIYIFAIKRASLRRHFDTVAAAESGLDLPINILMYGMRVSH